MNKSQIVEKKDAQGPSKFKSHFLRESLFSNEGECLEYLLERLENGSNQGLMSSTDKLMLRGDKNMYSRLTNSKPLLQIFKLMNNVEKASDTSKQDFDFEFEKLLLQLKNEYNSLFNEKKALKAQQ